MAEQKFNPKDLQIALKTFDYESVVQIKLAEEIDPIVAKNAKCVKLTEKRYYTVDVSDAMRKLTLCGDLIQLSYVSTDGFKAQAEVGKLLSNYSTLVKSSYIGACKFVEASISALGYHRLALELLKKKPNKSIVFLGKCGELAKEMAGVAAHLSSEAKKMVDIATGALTQAISDKSVSVQQRKTMEIAMEKANALKHETEKLQKSLNEKVRQAKEEEEQAIKSAEDERSRRFALDIIKGVTQPLLEAAQSFSYKGMIGGAVNSGMDAVGSIASAKNDNDKKKNDDDEKKEEPQGKTLDDRAYLLTKERMKLQDKLLKQNENLAQTVSELAGLKDEKNQLQRALKSLETAIGTLGKIQVIFNNTRVFWEGVEANCKACSRIGSDVKVFEDCADDEDIQEEIKDAIVDSTLNWFVLAKVNFYAKKAIIGVDKKMDGIMNDLPNEAQALKMIDPLAAEMQEQLRLEHMDIKAAVDTQK
eukprot:453330_1